MSNETDKKNKTIKVYSDVLDHSFATQLLETSLATLHGGAFVYKTNYAWSQDVVGVSNPVLIVTLPEDETKAVCDALIKKGVIESDEGVVCMNYIWTRGSYIPLHNDKNYDFAMTIYLNPEWHINWGGLFLYQDIDYSFRAVVPSFNTAVVNLAAVPHAVSIIGNDAPPRVTLQLFKKRYQDD